MVIVENAAVLKPGVAVGEVGEVDESVVRTATGNEVVDGGWGNGVLDDVFLMDWSWLVAWESEGVMTAGLNTAWDELSVVAEESAEVDDTVLACDPVIESSKGKSPEVTFNWRARRFS